MSGILSAGSKQQTILAGSMQHLSCLDFKHSDAGCVCVASEMYLLRVEQRLWLTSGCRKGAELVQAAPLVLLCSQPAMNTLDCFV